MRRYLVIAVEDCPRCGGDGMVEELHSVTQDIRKIECPDCRGNGFIEGKVPLEDAIRGLRIK